MSPAIRRYKAGSHPPAAAANRLVAVIPAGMTTAPELLAALAKGLCFPAWFGNNWNALSDCLRDLGWIEAGTIVIFHEDRPALPAADLEIYLDVLAEAVASWQPGEAHALEVWMPQEGTRHKALGTRGKANSRV